MKTDVGIAHLSARASAQRQEFAIRGALGVGRVQLVRQLLVECLMLAITGALLGIRLAWAAGLSILHMLGNAEAEEAVSMRPGSTVLCVTVTCAMFCALLFGLALAWTASHTNVERWESPFSQDVISITALLIETAAL
jgi:ABC-type antimicrobial peptide transport system permease subunit